MICHRPVNICARSGIKNAATTKLTDTKPKNSFRKLLSERFLILFITHLIFLFLYIYGNTKVEKKKGQFS